MVSFIMAIAYIVGVVAFAFFVVSVAIYAGYLALGTGTFFGYSDSAWTIFGVLASGAAVGLYLIGRED